MNCLIQSLLIREMQLKKRHNLKVIQRYLRIHYHIHLSEEVLQRRIQLETKLHAFYLPHTI